MAESNDQSTSDQNTTSQMFSFDQVGSKGLLKPITTKDDRKIEPIVEAYQSFSNSNPQTLNHAASAAGLHLKLEKNQQRIASAAKSNLTRKYSSRCVTEEMNKMTTEAAS